MTQPRFKGTPVIKPRFQGVPVEEMVPGQAPNRFPLPPAPYPKPPAFIGGLTEAFAGPYQAAIGGEEYGEIYEPYRQAGMPTTPSGMLGRLAGQAAPYLGVPGGTAGGLGRRAATGALAGGAQGALSYVPPGESRQRQGIIGAATGGAVPAGLVAGKRMLADPLAAGTRSLAKPIDVPDQLQPYDPTLGQITKDPTQWARERNLARLEVEGIPMRERFTQQNQQLIQKAGAQRATEETFQTATHAQRVAKVRDRMTQMPVGRAYTYARTAIGSNLELDPRSMAPKWRGIVEDFEDRLPSNIKTRMESFIPVFDDSGKLVSGGRAYTPNEINKAIQLINDDLYDFATPKAVKAGLTRTKKLLDADLKSFEDADISDAAQAWKTARKAAAERFRARGGSDKGPIAELVRPDFKTETWINRHVIGGEKKDLERMVKYFRGYRKGDDVLHHIARQVDEHLYNKALSKAEIEFKGTNYRDALNKIGETKGRLLWGDEGWESRLEFAEASRELTTTPFGSAVGWSNTAPTLFGFMDAAGAGRWPLVGKAVQTWRRGARESAQSREIKGALERLPDVWNAAYQRWMDKLTPAAGPAIQGVRAGAVPLAIELTRSGNP